MLKGNMREINEDEQLLLGLTLMQYRDSQQYLILYREKTFSIGLRVLVNTTQYNGPGVVADPDGCPLDKVAVRLPNDNVWWYPIESVIPV